MTEKEQFWAMANDLKDWIAGITPAGVGIWLALAGFGGKWLVERGKLRKINLDGEAVLRTDLIGRINRLESEILEERRECDRRLRLMQEKLDTMQDSINGWVRQMAQFQQTTGMAMPLAVKSPEIQHALETLEKLHHEDGK